MYEYTLNHQPDWSFAAILVLALFVVSLFRYAGKSAGPGKHPPFKLVRFKHNPVLDPVQKEAWEQIGSFNPAAFVDNEGIVHLFYRAVGSDGLSRIGYASSEDGVTFSDRSTYPIHVPTRELGLPPASLAYEDRRYDTIKYSSGGGWGGCEDPRVVQIGDRVYMTYVAFGGWDSIRIALTSTSLDDLKHKRWQRRISELPISL
ncbi:MAG: hypothetical protein V4674_02835, partial [Patescibacteria group bacterium]